MQREQHIHFKIIEHSRVTLYLDKIIDILKYSWNCYANSGLYFYILGTEPKKVSSDKFWACDLWFEILKYKVTEHG